MHSWFLPLPYSSSVPVLGDDPEQGIRRRAWGRVHLMRSGKRSGEGGPWAPAWGVERADLGIGVEPLSDLVLRRVSRQSGGRGGRSGGWGGGHMLRTGGRVDS